MSSRTSVSPGFGAGCDARTGARHDVVRVFVEEHFARGQLAVFLGSLEHHKSEVALHTRNEEARETGGAGERLERPRIARQQDLERRCADPLFCRGLREHHLVKALEVEHERARLLDVAFGQHSKACGPHLGPLATGRVKGIGGTRG